MRMDRYEEENIDTIKKSRTDKNQELYTDVYLNNAYVDISEINEVVSGEEKIEEEPRKTTPEVVPYIYKEKNYDINEIINEAINNNQDNLKRSIEQTTEIDSIIKTINENQTEKEKNNNLMSELLPDSDTTTIIGPLEEAITSTNIYDTSILHKNEMSNDLAMELEKEEPKEKKVLEESKDLYDELPKKKEIEEIDEVDQSLANETKVNKKLIAIVVGVVLVIIVIIVLLIWKKIIKI